MTPQAFIAKWHAVELKERSASQSHFNDICVLLDVVDPISADPRGEWFMFEKGASKSSGGEGWADVWRKDCFAWEYKGKRKDLNAALTQLQQYTLAEKFASIVQRLRERGHEALVCFQAILAKTPNQT